MLTNDDLTAILLTLKLATITTIILLIICIPLATWLTFTKSKFKLIAVSLATLPLVLPPSVIGFYLLVLFNPHGFIGSLMNNGGIGTLPFTFRGLVVASVIYSLPFVLQPIYNAFQALGSHTFEVAATLRANKYVTFFHLFIPQAKISILSGAVLGFAHTMGEFGVVLMIGGNIPGKTQVASLQIYNHVEAFEYHQANMLSLILLGSSFVILLLISQIQHKANYLNKI